MNISLGKQWQGSPGGWEPTQEAGGGAGGPGAGVGVPASTSEGSSEASPAPSWGRPPHVSGQTPASVGTDSLCQLSLPHCPPCSTQARGQVRAAQAAGGLRGGLDFCSVSPDEAAVPGAGLGPGPAWEAEGAHLKGEGLGLPGALSLHPQGTVGSHGHPQPLGAELPCWVLRPALTWARPAPALLVG